MNRNGDNFVLNLMIARCSKARNHIVTPTSCEIPIAADIRDKTPSARPPEIDLTTPLDGARGFYAGHQHGVLPASVSATSMHQSVDG
jgi:hypothetical protein